MLENATIGIIVTKTIEPTTITKIVSISHAIEFIKTARILPYKIVIRKETMLVIKISTE